MGRVLDAEGGRAMKVLLSWLREFAPDIGGQPRRFGRDLV